MDEILENSAEPEKTLKTFYQDDLLPSLPLPSIHSSVEKYLDSCKAVLSEEEYENTREICKTFMDGEALSHQIPLARKAIEKRNWLEEWWMDYAYLKVRKPIMYSYFAVPGSFMHKVWPLQEGTQLERSAIALYNIMQFWQMLKKEIFPQQKAGNNSFMTMHQFRYLYNTTRIPKRDKDEMRYCFETSSEGDSPTHLIIFYRNRMYRIHGVNQKTGRILTPPEFYKILLNIVDTAPQSYGESVAALTCLERDTWADARDHMIRISERNERNLGQIEDALMCFGLSESRPMNLTQLLKEGLSGSCSNRWNDKSFNYTATSNGGFVGTVDHSPYEGLVSGSFVVYSPHLIKLAEEKFPKPWDTAVEVSLAEELLFDLDDQLRDNIRKGLTECHKFTADLDVSMRFFRGFGKSELKELKIHPDGFVQLCLQLTYMRMYVRPAPTYETATTRSFYRGRTETARTCTPEAVAFCRAMMKGSQDSVSLFHKAYEKFMTLMDECRKGFGCDRHLMGIALQAMESGEPLPALFTDPAYAKTGGGGNFTLSTSFGGFTDVIGCCSAMVEHGFGAFYSVSHDRMIIATSAWNGCSTTDAGDFMTQLHQSLLDVYEMLKQHRLSKL